MWMSIRHVDSQEGEGAQEPERLRRLQDHANHRYILDDGRIGVCRFRGRTAFGKSSEDWVGLVLEYAHGKINVTVNEKTYFW